MVVEWPLAGLVVVAFLYAFGRREHDTLRRDAYFYGGLLVLVVAIDSPVDTYADRLFWVHMVQHVLLTMVAPPLILLGRPWPRIVRALPSAARRAIARGLLACLRLPRRSSRSFSSTACSSRGMYRSCLT